MQQKRAGSIVESVAMLAALLSLLVLVIVVGGREMRAAKDRAAISEGQIMGLEYVPASTTTTIVDKVPVPIFNPEQYVVTVSGWDAKNHVTVKVDFSTTAAVFQTLRVGDHIQTAILLPPPQ